MPRYSETEARRAIAAARSWSDALRRLGMCTSGRNAVILKRWAQAWAIPTAHFDHNGPRSSIRRTGLPLESILVEGSTYSRGHLKERLYQTGLKLRRCEMCGQEELWHGRPMALILDHINGIATDNRLENLRIVCPSCAATLDTHCGRKLRLDPQQCERCQATFQPRYRAQRFCSRKCSLTGPRKRRGMPQPERRLVQRPPYKQLLREIAATSYLAVGRRYGVSDNAIRKWVRQYERELQQGRDQNGPLNRL